VRTRTTIGIIAGLLALDRVLKLSTQKGLTEGWSFFGWYPRITLHHNYGAAFDLALPQPIIVVASILILVVLSTALIHAWKYKSRTGTPLLLILVGAASNLFDRIQFGYVIDLLEFIPGSIWNIADGMILVGLIWLLQKKSTQTLNPNS
jgi:lipoprotein signal peptidase